MPETHNTTLIAAIDCPGGGQVWIDGTTLYVAHMNPPAGTSIYDVADPRPRAFSPMSRCRRAIIRIRCAPATG